MAKDPNYDLYDFVIDYDDGNPGAMHLGMRNLLHFTE